MVINGVIKAFGKNINKTKKIISSYTPLHLKLSFPKDETLLYIGSESNKDSYDKEGAKAVIINGLDIDYNEINEIIKLNGNKYVKTTRSFYRINNIIVIDCGNLKYNQGNIYITNSNNINKNNQPKKILYHTIGQYENLSCCGIYTVPKGYTWQMKHFNTTADLSFFDTILVNVYIKPELFSDLEIVELYFNCFNTNVEYPIQYMNSFDEKTDIYITSQKTKLFNNVVKFGCYYQYELLKKI